MGEKFLCVSGLSPGHGRQPRNIARNAAGSSSRPRTHLQDIAAVIRRIRANAQEDAGAMTVRGHRKSPFIVAQFRLAEEAMERAQRALLLGRKKREKMNDQHARRSVSRQGQDKILTQWHEAIAEGTGRQP